MIPETLYKLGYNEDFEKFRTENNLTDFEIGRVIQEHKERYIIATPDGEFNAEVTGKIMYGAESRLDFPAVGDWVAYSLLDDTAYIHDILKRQSLLVRNASGNISKPQVVAANVDVALIVISVNRDFSLNRVERYLTICNESNIKPVVVLSKTDLITEDELSILLKESEQRLRSIDIVPVSSVDLSGYDSLKKHLESGKTYCLLGSSGVGKSTIINKLTGSSDLKTSEISESINRGKHTTTHRELVIHPNGSLFIDNPGMREVGLTDTSKGLQETFDDIYNMAPNCRYSDCSHIHESGCAVIQAVEDGEISKDSYNNYLKLAKEMSHYESDQLERKRKGKDLSKVIKNFKKTRY